MSRIVKTNGALIAGIMALTCAAPALAAGPQSGVSAPLQQNQNTTQQYQQNGDDYQNQDAGPAANVVAPAPVAAPNTYYQPAQSYSASQWQQNAPQPGYPAGQNYPVTPGQWQQSSLQQTGGMSYMRPVQEGNMTYITGGIGEDEQNALQAEASNYNLQITNSDKTGHFTADTNLTIEGNNGREMVNVQKTGPLFYAQLPPGTYKVDASNGGQHHAQTVTVSAHKATDVHFVWPASI